MPKITYNLIFVVFCCLFIQSCEKESSNPAEILITEEPTKNISTILFDHEITPGIYDTSFASFDMTSESILNLDNAYQKEIIFKGQQLSFSILDFASVTSYKIFVAFRSQAESLGAWEDSEGIFSLHCIGQNQWGIYFITIGSKPVNFEGKIFCFTFPSPSNNNVDEIKVLMKVDESIVDTLKINPVINSISTNNLLNVKRIDLSQGLPDNNMGVRILDLASKQYLFGCIWTNSSDNYIEVTAYPSNALFYHFGLNEIKNEYDAYFFAYPK